MTNYNLSINEMNRYDGKIYYTKYIKPSDIISLQIEDNSFPEYSKIVVTTKAHEDYIDMIPTKNNDKNPILIKWYNSEQETQEVFFVVSKEYIKEVGNEYVIFQGASFDIFESERLVNSNKDYSNTDDTDLPDDFGTYTKTGSVKDILDDVYYDNILLPKKPTYGVLPSEFSQDRKVKGLGDINVEDVSETTTINVDYSTTITELKEKLFSQTDIILECNSDIVNNYVQVNFEQGKDLTHSLIKRENEITKNGYGAVATTNAILGTANPNNFYYLSEVEVDEFTVREKTTDSAFINGSNATYLENTTITELATQKKERLLKILEIKDLENLTSAGDYIYFEDTKYRVTSIVYSMTNQTFSKTLSIEEE